MATPQQRFHSGEHVDKYIIDSRIGAGGMGEVWKAHAADGFPVAIKFAHPLMADDPYFRDFARQEASTALVHPNIVQVVDTFEVDGLPAIVFEFVEGGDLESEIYGSASEQDFGRPLPVRVATRIARDVLAALDYAHQQGLVHRDVKSSNILIEKQTGKARLSDFGLVMDVSVRRKTRYGMMAGCVPYMSPEQIRDNRSVDHRSDIYSFGIVLYEMLTGVLPFRKEPGETENADYLIKHKHRYATPVPPGSLNTQVPAALDRIVLRALEKDRDHRYASCEEFAQDLQKLATAPSKRVIVPPSFEYVPPPAPVVAPLPAARGHFPVSPQQVNSYLPWALIGCSALIVTAALFAYLR